MDQKFKLAHTAVALPLERKVDALGATQVSTYPPGSEEPSARERELTLGVGDHVGRFVIQGPLGEGGMGMVFLGRDPELQRDVALKVIRPAKNETQGTAAQARMLREAQAMAMLSHPNLVAIYEAGKVGDHIYLAMEYVVGETLGSWLKKSHPLEDIMEVFDQAGQALVALHEAGLVHRDFKPANVMVTEQGVAKVLDLGIARKVNPNDHSVEELSEESGDKKERSEEQQEEPSSVLDCRIEHEGIDAFADNLTVEGAIVGTPSYMAPEQFLAEGVGPAADQFTFAVALYEALTGTRPYQGNNHVQFMANVFAGDRTPWPADCEAPLGLRVALERALSAQVGDRYATMCAFLEACRSGLGLRGQIRFLTNRYINSDRDRQYLLPGGQLLSEGLDLIKNQPGALNAAQEAFILESSRLARRRSLQRRGLVLGILTLGLLLIPTLALLRRRSEQLEMATRAEILAQVRGVQEAVAPVMADAEQQLLLMYAQREAWMRDVQTLLLTTSAAPTELADVNQPLTTLNHFFRPVIKHKAAISSMMIARNDEFEVLFFQDPDAEHLSIPHDFYNRIVWQPVYGQSAIEAFWRGEHLERVRRLDINESDVRGANWAGYSPSKRVWFKTAVAQPPGMAGWTAPYLFFVTKDAGVTGGVQFSEGGHQYVLAVDFMLTDLSRITAEVTGGDFVAAITNSEGRLIALPRDPRFPSADAIRQFFAKVNSSAQLVDAEAHLPTAQEAALPHLAAAIEAATDEKTYQFTHLDQTLWAARAPVEPKGLGLWIYVVERPHR